MANREFRERLSRRARSAGVSIENRLIDGLETYYQLLTKWNAKINLTAFRLTPEGSDDAIDRLLIEPVVAASYIPENARTLLDADASRKRRDAVVDKMAAAYILQGALDRLRHMKLSAS